MNKEIDTRTYVKRDVVLFNSYSKTTEVLSNHHVCELRVGGYIFNSAEQLFYCMLLSKYPEYQDDIFHLSDVKEIKKKGDRYLKKIGWDDNPYIEIPYLRFCQQVKYIQCEEFRIFLQTHPDVPLVEYAWGGDGFWGAFDENPEMKFNWYKGNVTGKNVCGRIMMGVRKQFKDNPSFAPEVPEEVMMLGIPLNMEGEPIWYMKDSPHTYCS